MAKGMSARIRQADLELTQQHLESLNERFQSLISAASLIHITPSHRAAACNALCAFVDACIRSDVPVLKALVVSESSWLRILDIYLTRSTHAKVKSMRQVLGTLSGILTQQSDPLVSMRLKSASATVLLSVIHQETAGSGIKPAYQAIEYFLAKDVFSILELLRSFIKLSRVDNSSEAICHISSGLPIGTDADQGEHVSSRGDNSPNLQRMPGWNEAAQSLTRIMLKSILEPDIAPAAGKLTITFHKKLKQLLRFEGHTNQICPWFPPMKDIIEMHVNALDHFKQHILPGLFQLDKADYFHILHALGIQELLSGALSESDVNIRFLFVALEVGNEHGFFSILTGPTVDYKLARDTAPREVGTVVRRDGPTMAKDDDQAETIEDYWSSQTFLFIPAMNRALLDLLLDPFDDVRDEAAAILHCAFPGAEHIPSSNPTIEVPDDLQAKEHGLSTAFDDIRPPEICPIGYETFLSRATQLVEKTGRADHADGLARGFELYWDSLVRDIDRSGPCGNLEKDTLAVTNLLRQIVSNLEHQADIARTDLLQAVSNTSIHGVLASLRYLYDRRDVYDIWRHLPGSEKRVWKDCHSRSIACCQVVWEAVRAVLCVDSPEGHLPSDGGLDPAIGTKDILSFCWRALKESSLLLRAIISTAVCMPRENENILDATAFATIGDLSFTQLAELRHRGAFSTVSGTFAACCQRCTQIEQISVKELPEGWYQRALLCIQHKSSQTTRRSAGLPSLVTGILSAHAEKPLFQRAMTDLLAESRIPPVVPSEGKDLELPQVHALNCLKDIFLDTRLGLSSEAYVGEGLEVAAECLGSAIWAIRNCGVMLIRALTTRLFRSNRPESQPGRKVGLHTTPSIYVDYPRLAPILTRLLEATATSQDMSSGVPEVASEAIEHRVYPALDIIRRAGLPRTERLHMKNLIYRHLGAQAWHVREMAAQTYSSLIGDGDVYREIETLLKTPIRDQNSLHGRLLTLGCLLQKFDGQCSVSWDGTARHLTHPSPEHY
ncbi:MAG: hypothetical protein M1817_004540 [Caeruleum heppii]|nr:MAG: hypothetical protein M1817_004540 [Caeruleum heppii]